MRRLPLVLSLLVALATLSCGSDDTSSKEDAITVEDTASGSDTTASADTTANTDTTASDTTTTADTSTGDTVSDDTVVAQDTSVSDVIEASVCPATLPNSGEACTREGLTCQYGEEPRLECRPVAVCTDGFWLVGTPNCDPLPAVTCPETREAAAGQLCEPFDAYCNYDGLVCHCSNCYEYPVGGCQGDVIWQCDRPNPDPACPTARPNLGTGCESESQRCEYECGHDGARICEGGVWVSAEGGPCPISTRTLKRDIRPLDAFDEARIASEVMAIRLSTYHYTDPSIAAGLQLGFIIEDIPGSLAVDAQRKMVNLYGYASMLLATIHTQQRSISEMEARLERLEKRLAELER